MSFIVWGLAAPARRRASSMRSCVAVLVIAVLAALPRTAACQSPALLDTWTTHGGFLLCRPLGVSLDHAGNLYVADPCARRIFSFSADGAPLNSWPSPKPIWYIAASGSNRVYASQPTANDTSGASVFVFTTNGDLVARWHVNGTGAGEFDNPEAIAVDENGGDIFVTESGNARVQRLTADGQYLTQWGSRGAAPGQFNDPEGIALGPEGLVYVTDAVNQTVQVFTKEGQRVRGWGGELGAGPGQFQGVRGIAVDLHGNVYVADAGNARIQVFTSRGTYVAEWGTFGDGPGQFRSPYSIAVASDGRVFVGDFTARIQVFGSLPTRTSTTSWGRLKSLYR